VERSNWEKEVAENEVASLLLTEELSSSTERLRDLQEHAAATKNLRAQLSTADCNTREKKSAQSEYILHLPDEFYNGHLKEVNL